MPTTTAKAPTSKKLATRGEAARDRLDAWVREVVAWHFDPETGTPFWLDWAQQAGLDPRKEVKGYADLDKFGFFQDEWLRGGPVRRWVPKGYAERPISIFETGGSTGVPKSRISIDDFRIDYEMFSDTLPDDVLPEGRRLAAWSARAARAACGSPSSTWASTAAASASWSTSTRAG